MRAKLFLLAFFATTIAGSQSTDVPRVGSISGEVVDAKGSPIAGAKVFDEPMDAVRTGKDHFATCGEDGKFLLSDVPVGKAMVIATKTEDGYPDARFAVFSGNEILPVVQVNPDQVTSGVVVKLLAKGGTLLGRVLDASTKLAIPDARITISRLDHPTWLIETNVARDGTFNLVVPAMHLHFSVTANRFKAWNYEQSPFSKDHSPLLISPSSKLDVPIYLERAP